jgi:hypothetical protein
MVHTLFIASVLGATACLVAAIVVARLHWRHDIAPFGRDTNALRVLLRPASYTRESSVAGIRVLTVLGCALYAAALLCLVYQALADFGGS